MHTPICTFSVYRFIYIRLCSHPWLLLWLVILLLCRYNALWNESRYCVSATVQVILLICQHLFFFFFWPFIFTEKSDCDIIFNSRIKLVLSVTIIIAMLVKLLQMIWGYVTSIFCCQIHCLSVCVFDVWKVSNFISYWYYVTYFLF